MKAIKALFNRIIDFFAMCILFPLLIIFLIIYGLFCSIWKVAKLVAKCLIGKILEYDTNMIFEAKDRGSLGKIIDIVFSLGHEN